jgi:hypothetical protein
MSFTDDIFEDNFASLGVNFIEALRTAFSYKVKLAALFLNLQFVFFGRRRLKKAAFKMMVKLTIEWKRNKPDRGRVVHSRLESEQ